ncbi:MAG: hypothetical protein QOH03_799 [Kribbellaceae bacterium]|jgi:hypothetical protein|nr:hypothetical protein [Kribbellaceae bacterium]
MTTNPIVPIPPLLDPNDPDRPEDDPDLDPTPAPEGDPDEDPNEQLPNI